MELLWWRRKQLEIKSCCLSWTRHRKTGNQTLLIKVVGEKITSHITKTEKYFVFNKPQFNFGNQLTLIFYDFTIVTYNCKKIFFYCHSFLLICKLSHLTVHYSVCFFQEPFLKALITCTYCVFAGGWKPNWLNTVSFQLHTSISRILDHQSCEAARLEPRSKNNNIKLRKMWDPTDKSKTNAMFISSKWENILIFFRNYHDEKAAAGEKKQNKTAQAAIPSSRLLAWWCRCLSGDCPPPPWQLGLRRYFSSLPSLLQSIHQVVRLCQLGAWRHTPEWLMAVWGVWKGAGRTGGRRLADRVLPRGTQTFPWPCVPSNVYAEETQRANSPSRPLQLPHVGNRNIQVFLWLTRHNVLHYLGHLHLLI